MFVSGIKESLRNDDDVSNRKATNFRSVSINKTDHCQTFCVHCTLIVRGLFVLVHFVQFYLNFDPKRLETIASWYHLPEFVFWSAKRGPSLRKLPNFVLADNVTGIFNFLLYQMLIIYFNFRAFHWPSDHVSNLKGKLGYPSLPMGSLFSVLDGDRDFLLVYILSEIAV